MTSLPVEKTKALIIHSFIYFSISVVLTLASAENPWIGRIGYSVISELFYPVHKIANEVSNFIAQQSNNYLELIGVQDENSKLKSELFKIRVENLALKEEVEQNKNLKKLLKFKQKNKLKGFAASVIARDPSQWMQALTIDQGTSAGVAIGDAVVVNGGAVGQVISCSSHTAKVLLITDLQSAVDVFLQSNRARAVVKGYGLAKPELQFLNREYSLQRGDLILTSGLDGVFPRGILVGHVHDIIQASGSNLFHKAFLRTAVDFDTLENVLVIKRANLDQLISDSTNNTTEEKIEVNTETNKEVNTKVSTKVNNAQQ
jgi:rod shape-determining protein MreC